MTGVNDIIQKGLSNSTWFERDDYTHAFPNLGLYFNIDPVAFQLGTIKVHWYGIIIAAAIMIALTLAMRQTKKFNIKEDDMVDMFLIALPVSIIFARLFFVVFTWENFKNDLLGIFRIWEGGLAIYGAIIGAVISVFIYSRKKKISMLELCDFACVYLPLAQAIGRWGNFANQELYGSNTDLPWGMTGNRIITFPDPGVDPTKLVHPTFLYESILNIIVFVVLLRIRKNHKAKGTVFASYLMLYSLVRFLLEFVRVDVFGVGAIRYNQVFAALVFIGALAWFFYLKKKARREDEANETTGPSAYSGVLQEIKEEEGKEAAFDKADIDEAETAGAAGSSTTDDTGEDASVAAEAADDTAPNGSEAEEDIEPSSSDD